VSGNHNMITAENFKIHRQKHSCGSPKHMIIIHTVV